MSNRAPWPRKTVFFIDPIEASSYPVTETGYALLYRSWLRSTQGEGTVYAVYPDTELRSTISQGRPVWTVDAHLVEHFSASPYEHFRSQRQSYDAAADVGSARCHHEAAAQPLALADADVIVFRQESGPEDQRTRLLRALEAVEDDVLVYLSPRLALDPESSSKVLPTLIAPDCVPASFATTACAGTPTAKVEAALRFVREALGSPDTFIAKPTNADNGVGITCCGQSPIATRTRRDPRATLTELMAKHGDFIVQEYLPSVRAPRGISSAALRDVPVDRRDFGEIRFLLIDGVIPRTPDGQRIQVARRVPTDASLVADSGISYATTLSVRECEFLEHVGREYVKRGIHFGGGDLIRTPDPARPFLFTDAARSVCGHAVVTGALNGAPYLIVDQVLDSIERRLVRRQLESGERSRPAAPRMPPRKSEALGSLDTSVQRCGPSEHHRPRESARRDQ